MKCRLTHGQHRFHAVPEGLFWGKRVLSCYSAGNMSKATLPMTGKRLGAKQGRNDEHLQTSVGDSTSIVSCQFALRECADGTGRRLLGHVGSRPELVERLSVPLNQYEIVIDEVLKEEVGANSIVLHRIGTAPDARMTDSSVARLFFLVMNPDEASYSATYILSKRGDNYIYEFLAPMIPQLPPVVRSVSLPFAATMDAVALEESIRRLVAQ